MWVWKEMGNYEIKDPKKPITTSQIYRISDWAFKHSIDNGMLKIGAENTSKLGLISGSPFARCESFVKTLISFVKM